MNFGNCFSYFYNNEIYLATKSTARNEIGQEIDGYVRKITAIKCDVQPIDEKGVKYTWGEDIESNLQVFCDELLEVDDIIIFNNKVYQVEKVIDWGDYKIYAIKSSDIEVIV